MKKILVVEDDSFIASAYRVKLEKSGFETKIVYDGKEALEALNMFTPDLILLDVVMPVMDGFSFLKEIKKDDKFNSIPVIVTSNLGQKEDIENAKDLGADDYVVKSDLSMDNLLKKISLYIGSPNDQSPAEKKPDNI